MTTTADIVAALQAYPSPSAPERDLVEYVKGLAGQVFRPALDAEAAGHALMHVAQLHAIVIDNLRESDPALDWESLATLAHNIIGVAGMELYTGTALGKTPEPDKE